MLCSKVITKLFEHLLLLRHHRILVSTLGSTVGSSKQSSSIIFSSSSLPEQFSQYSFNYFRYAILKNNINPSNFCVKMSRLNKKKFHTNVLCSQMAVNSIIHFYTLQKVILQLQLNTQEIHTLVDIKINFIH